jgi:hypothetical protein
VESFQGPPALFQLQKSFWDKIGVCGTDTFVLLSHALLYFESLTFCMTCAVEVEGKHRSEHHNPDDEVQLDLERINMIWIACVHLAVLALTHSEAREVPYETHAHLEDNIWEAL